MLPPCCFLWIKKTGAVGVPCDRSLSSSLDQCVSCPRGLSVGSAYACSPRDHEEVHSIKKWNCWGFQAVYSSVQALAGAAPCMGPCKGGGHSREGSSTSGSGFSCMNRGCFGVPLHHPCTVLSVCLSPRTKCVCLLTGKGLSSALGWEDRSHLHGDLMASSLWPQERVTRLAGACFWARNQWFHPPGYQKKADRFFWAKRGSSLVQISRW